MITQSLQTEPLRYLRIRRACHFSQEKSFSTFFPSSFCAEKAKNQPGFVLKVGARRVAKDEQHRLEAQRLLVVDAALLHFLPDRTTFS